MPIISDLLLADLVCRIIQSHGMRKVAKMNKPKQGRRLLPEAARLPENGVGSVEISADCLNRLYRTTSTICLPQSLIGQAPFQLPENNYIGDTLIPLEDNWFAGENAPDAFPDLVSGAENVREGVDLVIGETPVDTQWQLGELDLDLPSILEPGVPEPEVDLSLNLRSRRSRDGHKGKPLSIISGKAGKDEDS